MTQHAPRGPDRSEGARTRALQRAVGLAVLAVSEHDARPWRLRLHPDRLDIRADRTRQPNPMDPPARTLAQSVGAALFTARVSLAWDGWAAEVQRFPGGDD